MLKAKLKTSPRINSTKTELSPISLENLGKQKLTHKPVRPLHHRSEPLWKGPYAEGGDGITNSLLCKFLVCRHRFWMKTVLGIKEDEGFSQALEYGNFFHLAEEATLAGQPWLPAMRKHFDRLCNRYPGSVKSITKWYQISKVQFPIYLKHYAAEHSAAKPILQEVPFAVPYRLPSGRTILLRGKFDSVERVDHSIYLKENKSKGTIDLLGMQRTIDQNLQCMIYQVALRAAFKTEYATHDPSADVMPRINGKSFRCDCGCNVFRSPQPNKYVCNSCRASFTGEPPEGVSPKESKPHHQYFQFGNRIFRLPSSKSPYQIAGTIYNVIRRPLSDQHAIKQRKGRKVKDPVTGKLVLKGAESDEQFYKRVGEVIEANPSHYFIRQTFPLRESQITTFCQECLHPILEGLCDWWDSISRDPFNPWITRFCNCSHGPHSILHHHSCPAVSPTPVTNLQHWRHPFGVYSSMASGFRGDYFDLVTTGSRNNIVQVETLFPELETEE